MHYDSLLDCLADAEQQAIAKNAPPALGQGSYNQQIQDFLACLWPRNPGGVFFLFTQNGNWGGKNHPFEMTGTWDEIAESAEDLDSRGNVYFAVGVQELKESVTRTADGVSAIPGFWCDIDVRGDGHVKAALPGTIEEARKFVNGLLLKPSVIVASGGGLHCYWLFNKPWALPSPEERSRAQALSRRFGKYVIAEGEKFGWKLDNVSDIARLLRLPGTHNQKANQRRPVWILDRHDERRYSPESFSALPEICPKPASKPSNSVIPATSTIADGERNTTLFTLGNQLCRQGLSDQVVEVALLATNQNQCQPPLEIPEVLGIVRRVCGYRVEQSASSKAKSEIQLPTTDMGNATRLIQQHGDFIRYCASLNKWFIWNGSHWAADSREQVMHFAQQTVESISDEAAAELDSARRTKLEKHAEKSQGYRKLVEMVASARSRPAIAIGTDDFDKDMMLFNCQSGVLDLVTGKLLPHDPKRMISKLAPVDYDPNARCPRWLKFLDRIMEGDSALIEFLQKTVGYSLSGLIDEQAFFFFYGTGCNGKSVFLDTVRKLLGNYGCQAEFSTFLMKQTESVRNDIARLKGARFVNASEMNAGKKVDISLLKEATGGESLTARFLYAEHFEFTPEFKLFLAANHKPEINTQDEGIWRRVRLVPFTVRIPEHERDPKLALKLRDELPGILNWALEGCRKWQAEGLGCPEAVQAATKEYQEDQDPLAEFLSQRCILKPSGEVLFGSLYKAYNEWCAVNNATVETSKKFSMCLDEKKFGRHRTKEGRFVVGIEIFQREGDEHYAE